MGKLESCCLSGVTSKELSAAMEIIENNGWEPEARDFDGELMSFFWDGSEYSGAGTLPPDLFRALESYQNGCGYVNYRYDASAYRELAAAIKAVGLLDAWDKQPDTLKFPSGHPSRWPAESPRVEGVGPDSPTVVNDCGGKQSQVNYRCDLLPPRAILAVAEVLNHGAAKYGVDNWRAIPVGDHVNHALTHLFAHQVGDRQDSHLAHAACRLLMAVDLAYSSKG